MENYKIEHSDNSSEGSFFVNQDDVKVAELSYVKRGKSININHTHVDETLQGKGVAKAMVMAAVEWARQNEIKISPTCSYAQAVFKRDSSLSDVLS